MSDTLNISAEQIPDRLARSSLLGPLTIMVPDFADPCGTNKIPRTVATAHPADTWDTTNARYTHGRWKIFFAGTYLYPMILITTADHPYRITTDPPDTPRRPVRTLPRTQPTGSQHAQEHHVSRPQNAERHPSSPPSDRSPYPEGADRPGHPEGAAILRLFRQLHHRAHGGTEWDGTDVITDVCTWLTDLGINPGESPGNAEHRLRLAHGNHPASGSPAASDGR